VYRLSSLRRLLLRCNSEKGTKHSDIPKITLNSFYIDDPAQACR